MNETPTVHHVLAKSYLSFFLASLFGLLLDSFIQIPFDRTMFEPVAIILLGVGPLLMLWAQITSWRCSQHNHSAAYFHHGPYRIVRNPTHLGILMLVTGYTLISGSVIFFLTTFCGFLISNIFYKKYERINKEVYGEHYEHYRKRTPRI